MITRPTLRFTPYAWAKLLFLRDHGPTEVGGFAITEPDDPTFVQDIRLVKQQCTAVTVAFDDDAVQEVLGLPDDHEPFGLMPVGRPR